MLVPELAVRAGERHVDLLAFELERESLLRECLAADLELLFDEAAHVVCKRAHLRALLGAEGAHLLQYRRQLTLAAEEADPQLLQLLGILRRLERFERFAAQKLKFFLHNMTSCDVMHIRLSAGSVLLGDAAGARSVTVRKHIKSLRPHWGEGRLRGTTQLRRGMLRALVRAVTCAHVAAYRHGFQPRDSRVNFAASLRGGAFSPRPRLSWRAPPLLSRSRSFAIYRL